MTTPFDELQAYCGPHGPGCRPHQPDCAVRTHGLPVWNCDCGQPVLDTEHPLFQALYELECGVDSCDLHLYTPRSRAEAAVNLANLVLGADWVDRMAADELTKIRGR